MSKKVRELVWYKKQGRIASPKLLKTREDETKRPAPQQKRVSCVQDEIEQYRIRLDAAVRKAAYKKLSPPGSPA